MLALILTFVAAVLPSAVVSHHDPDAAVRRLSALIAEAPREAGLYGRRGMLYLRRGELVLAERDFAWALGLGGGAPARIGLARVALRQGAVGDALAQARRVVHEAPDIPEAWRVLAAVRAATGDLTGRAAALETALECTAQPRPDDFVRVAGAWRDAGRRAGRALPIIEAGIDRFGGLASLRAPLEELRATTGRKPQVVAPPNAPREGSPGSVGPLAPPAATRLVESTLVAPGAVWRYLDDGSDQGTAWRQPGFDDSAWSTGPAQLGYGDGDEATVVGYGPNAANKYVTTWFRHAFQVTDPSTFASARLRVLRDDGAVVHLNGTEVARLNMPSGSIGYRTHASSAVGGSGEDLFHTIGVDPALLIAGRNVLAVEIHQANANSSDISFDLQLLGSDGRANLLRGPYLQRGTPTSAVVRWRTDVRTDTVLWLGPDPASLSPVYQSAVQVTEHLAAVSNLQPDTVHYYAVGDASGILAGGDSSHHFRTHPQPGTSGPRRIWVIGDSGTANADARRVRDAYLGLADRRDTDVWLMLGDNAYDRGTDAEYQAAVFDTYPGLLRNTFVWPTLGNHDAFSASSNRQSGPYYDIFTLPRAGESGGVPSGTEAYYSFDHGDIHFVCLDSHDTDRTSSAAMADWLRADLAANGTAHWTIAFWHHPPYTKGSHDSDDPADSGGRMRDMRQVFVPILESAGVDLVLTGHSHSYERSVLLDGHHGVSGTLARSMVLDGGDGRPLGHGSYLKPTFGSAAHEGAVYAVAGSSGKTGGGALNHRAMRVSINRLGSLVLDVDRDTLDGRFVDDQGRILDRFQMVKGPAPTLFRDAAAISVTRGGRQDWLLDLGATHAGALYVIAGSSSGTTPGFTLSGVHVPLNQDVWFDASLAAANTASLPSSTGSLDALGRARAAFVLPPQGPPALVGVQLAHAGVVLSPATGPRTATNPVALTLSR